MPRGETAVAKEEVRVCRVWLVDPKTGDWRVWSSFNRRLWSLDESEQNSTVLTAMEKITF